MGKSTLSARGRKGRYSKPHPDFPLTPHPSGRWCKRVLGKLRYFGKIEGDEKGQAALDEWLRVKDDLLAGRKPRDKRDGLPLVDLADTFLEAKENAVKSGELTRRHWNDLKATSERVLKEFGVNRVVEDLRPEDFEHLKASLTKGRNLTTIGNEVQRIRSLFKYAWDTDLISSPVKFGPNFKRPSKKARRRQRNERDALVFSADEIKAMLDAATPQLKAMILLGINTAMGNTDIADLPMNKLDLDGGWHSFGRPKTGVARRCPLWPETISAIREVLEHRPEPKDAADANRVFVTRHGQRYVRLKENGTWNDAISRETGKLLRNLGIKRDGLNFYTLRRTFRTIGDAAGDQPAITHVMGHADADNDMGATYRQYIADDRLQAVVNHVRAWLFPEAGADTEDKQGAGDDRPRFRVVG